MAEKLTIQTHLYKAYDEFIQKLMVDCEKSPNAGKLPIKFEALFGNLDYDSKFTLVSGALFA